MLKIYQSTPFGNTHENEQFRAVSEICKKCFANTEEPNLLFGNINMEGTPLDALFIKQNAIIILEFKNYGGNVTASENGDWKLDNGTIVKGGNNRNPFVQTHDNKFRVLNSFKRWFDRPYVNLGHIAGIVVFYQDVEIENLISPKVKSWFHITDMRGIAAKLQDIFSSEINYTEEDLDRLPGIYNYDEIRDLVYSNLDDYIDEITENDNGSESVCENICLPHITGIVQNDDADDGIDFNGGVYHGGWDKSLNKPKGKGIWEKSNIKYEGYWEEGVPSAEKSFTLISAQEDSFTYIGTVTKDLKPNIGRLVRDIEIEGQKLTVEYDGVFNGWYLREGKYWKNGVLYKEGLFEHTPQHNGRIRWELVEGRKREDFFVPADNCKYAGLIDIRTNQPDGEGEFTDAKGNKYVGIFTQGVPDENTTFTFTSEDTKRKYVGTIKKDFSFNEGRLTILEEGNRKEEYIGVFEGTNLKEGKYLQNGIDMSDHIPLAGHRLVENLKMQDNSIYNGIVDSNELPDADNGELIDRMGNKYVGRFIHGKKEGVFNVYIRNRTFAKRILYKDDIEVYFLDD